MQGFAEFIAENYHSTVNLIWDYVRAGLATAAFEIDAIRVTVRFEQKEADRWYVSFEVAKPESAAVVWKSFAIFNGVFQAATEFARIRNPEILVFAAKDPDLARIYRTYLRRDRAKIEAAGYRIEEPQSVEPFTEFTLRRVKPQGWKTFS